MALHNHDSKRKTFSAKQLYLERSTFLTVVQPLKCEYNLLKLQKAITDFVYIILIYY